MTASTSKTRPHAYRAFGRGSHRFRLLFEEPGEGMETLPRGLGGHFGADTRVAWHGLQSGGGRGGGCGGVNRASLRFGKIYLFSRIYREFQSFFEPKWSLRYEGHFNEYWGEKAWESMLRHLIQIILILLPPNLGVRSAQCFVFQQLGTEAWRVKITTE